MSDTVASTQKVHIVRTPGTVGGKPRIDGTRIRVQDIYVWYEMEGMSADEIVSDFPQLTLGDVYAALSYFWDHREEILAEMDAAAEAVEAFKKRFPSKLLSRGTDGTSNPPG